MDNFSLFFPLSNDSLQTFHIYKFWIELIVNLLTIPPPQNQIPCLGMSKFSRWPILSRYHKFLVSSYEINQSQLCLEIGANNADGFWCKQTGKKHYSLFLMALDWRLFCLISFVLLSFFTKDPLPGFQILKAIYLFFNYV